MAARNLHHARLRLLALILFTPLILLGFLLLMLACGPQLFAGLAADLVGWEDLADEIQKYPPLRWLDDLAARH